MPKVKSISFTEEYGAELGYLESKPNRSKYVCELIRKDLSGPVDDLEERIMKILKNKNLILRDLENNLNGEVGELLENLFEDLE